MPQILLRSAVIGYVLLLWVAVLPFSQLPLLGTARSFAERLLGAASLRAGMPVFKGSNPGPFAPHHSCVKIRGQGQAGWHTLYAPTCPPRGTQWRMDPLALAIKRMSLVQPQPLLRDPLPPPSEAPRALQIQIELGDYFCRSQPGLDRIVMERVLHVRNMRDGSPPTPGEVLSCKQECSEEYNPPECTLRRSEVLRKSLL